MNEQELKKLEKSSKFEERMSVVERDNPDLAKACRNVHNQLSMARTVAEAVFSDDVAGSPEIVMAISCAIADETDSILDERDREEDHEDDRDEA